LFSFVFFFFDRHPLPRNGSLKVDKSDARDDDEFKEEKERDAPKQKPFTTRAFLLGFFLKSSSFLFLISMAR